MYGDTATPTVDLQAAGMDEALFKSVHLRHVSGTEGCLTPRGNVYEQVGDHGVLLGEVTPRGVLVATDGESMASLLPGNVIVDSTNAPIGRVDAAGRVYFGTAQIGSLSDLDGRASGLSTADLGRGALALLLLPPREKLAPPFALERTIAIGLSALTLLIGAFGWLWVWSLSLLIIAATAAAVAWRLALEMDSESLARLRPAALHLRSGVVIVGVDAADRSRFVRVFPHLLASVLPGVAWCLFWIARDCVRLGNPLWGTLIVLLAGVALLGSLVARYVLNRQFDRLALRRKLRLQSNPDSFRHNRPMNWNPPLAGGATLIGGLCLVIGLATIWRAPTLKKAYALHLLPTPSPTPRPTPTPKPTPKPKPTPTPKPTPRPAKVARKPAPPTDPSSLSAIVRRRELREADVSSLSAAQLDRLRNEVFARHGFIFSSRRPDLTAHFGRTGWYAPDCDNSDTVFERRMNETERRNVIFLREYQIRTGRVVPNTGP